jgi:hypothetical protein
MFRSLLLLWQEISSQFWVVSPKPGELAYGFRLTSIRLFVAIVVLLAKSFFRRFVRNFAMDCTHINKIERKFL